MRIKAVLGSHCSKNIEKQVPLLSGCIVLRTPTTHNWTGKLERHLPPTACAVLTLGGFWYARSTQRVRTCWPAHTALIAQSNTAFRTPHPRQWRACSRGGCELPPELHRRGPLSIGQLLKHKSLNRLWREPKISPTPEQSVGA